MFAGYLLLVAQTHRSDAQRTAGQDPLLDACPRTASRSATRSPPLVPSSPASRSCPSSGTAPHNPRTHLVETDDPAMAAPAGSGDVVPACQCSGTTSTRSPACPASDLHHPSRSRAAPSGTHQAPGRSIPGRQGVLGRDDVPLHATRRRPSRATDVDEPGALTDEAMMHRHPIGVPRLRRRRVVRIDIPTANGVEFVGVIGLIMGGLLGFMIAFYLWRTRLKHAEDPWTTRSATPTTSLVTTVFSPTAGGPLWLGPRRDLLPSASRSAGGSCDRRFFAVPALIGWTFEYWKGAHHLWDRPARRSPDGTPRPRHCCGGADGFRGRSTWLNGVRSTCGRTGNQQSFGRDTQ